MIFAERVDGQNSRTGKKHMILNMKRNQ